MVTQCGRKNDIQIGVKKMGWLWTQFIGVEVYPPDAGGGWQYDDSCALSTFKGGSEGRGEQRDVRLDSGAD